MNLQVVQNFAAFLDNRQFAEAGECLSADCTYQYAEGKYQGKDNVVGIYQKNDSITRQHFDELLYSSDVEQIGNNEYKINYTDKLRKGALWHENHFYDVVKVEKGHIVDIHHHAIAGEPEAMMEFYKRATKAIISIP